MQQNHFYFKIISKYCYLSILYGNKTLFMSYILIPLFLQYPRESGIILQFTLDIGLPLIPGKICFSESPTNLNWVTVQPEKNHDIY